MLVALLNIFLEQGVMAKVTRLPKSKVAVFQKYQNFIVIEAFSDYTRIFIYKLDLNMSNGILVECENVRELGIKLSSSTLLDENKKAIGKFIDFAKSKINEKEWKKTPIVLKGTSGLRELPKDQSDNILRTFQKLLEDSTFKVTSDSASLLESKNEAFYSFLSVNLLLERLNPQSSQDTVAVLHLDDKSAKWAFQPRGNYNLNKIRTFKAFNSNIKIYADRSTDMSFNKARRNILITEPASIHNDKINKVRWECMNPHIDQTFEYEGEKYSITRPRDDSKNARLSLCLDIANEYTKKMTNIPLRLQSKKIYASYGYFYTAVGVRSLIIDIIVMKFVV